MMRVSFEMAHSDKARIVLDPRKCTLDVVIASVSVEIRILGDGQIPVPYA